MAKRCGWDLIEDPLIDVEATVNVMTTIADHVENEEERATAFDTMTRHLQADVEALRQGFRAASAANELTKRKKTASAVVPFRAAASEGDAA